VKFNTKQVATAGAIVGAAAVTAAVVAARRWRDTTGEYTRDAGELDDVERISVTTDDGAVLDGIVAGDGPTVVLVHGWVCNRGFWNPVARRLVASGHRVVIYDHRGHGRSTVGDAPASIARLGDDIAAVLDAVDARDAVLAGHSMGGMAAQAYVLDHPDDAADRLRGLVLVATAAAEVNRGWGELAVRIVGNPRIDRLLRSRVGASMMRGTVGRAPHMPHLVSSRDAFVGTSAEVRAAHLRAMGAMDHRHGLPSVQVPTTVIVGTRDTLTPPAQGRLIAELVPGARLVEAHGTGHMVHLEEPDLVANEIADLHRRTATARVATRSVS
jgi:pimeloyl-ACP methyl ester carboxylesterase